MPPDAAQRPNESEKRTPERSVRYSDAEGATIYGTLHCRASNVIPTHIYLPRGYPRSRQSSGAKGGQANGTPGRDLHNDKNIQGGDMEPILDFASGSPFLPAARQSGCCRRHRQLVAAIYSRL